MEVILLTDLLLGLFSNGFTIFNINWRLFPERYNALSVITFIFLITSLGTVLALMSFRVNKTIYTSNNLFAIYLTYFNMILSIIGVLIYVISLVKIHNLYDELEQMLSENNPKYINLFKSNGQWYIFTISEVLSIIFTVAALIIWSSVVQRLKCKIVGARIGNEGSYGKVEVKSTEMTEIRVN